MAKRMEEPRHEGDARREVICAGVDVGTECVKVLVISAMPPAELNEALAAFTFSVYCFIKICSTKKM